MDVSLGDKPANLKKCLKFLEMAAGQDIELVVFPECALTGYVFRSREEAAQMAETVPGESTRRLEEACRKYKITAVVGLLEQIKDKLYNSAALIGPQGLLGLYRKTHTLCLGVDRFVSRGEDLPVFSIPQGRLGILICYDQRFPEPARVMALKGAQMILNPANLPEGAEVYRNFFNRARACENRLFLINADRIGKERDTRFIGHSQIIDYSGRILAEASGDREEIIRAEIRPEETNVKHVINIPGEYEFDLLGDRRPDLYGEITGVDPQIQ
jgi:predicted amidohydrolase